MSSLVAARSSDRVTAPAGICCWPVIGRIATETRESRKERTLLRELAWPSSAIPVIMTW